jgi:hypothetical protein
MTLFNLQDYLKEEPSLKDINHREFKIFIDSFISQLEEIDEQLKKNNQKFREEYGIGRPPFFARKKIPKGFGITEIKKDANRVKIYGGNYSFTEVHYAHSLLGVYAGNSSISFDKGLIKKIKERGDLIEVESKNRLCVTCDNKEGKVYFTGLLIPSANENHNRNAVNYKSGIIDCDRNKLYLFERPCHSYLAADYHFGGLPKEQKPKGRPKKIELTMARKI